MLDAACQPSEAAFAPPAHWAAGISPGDLVSFRYPCLEPEGGPDKARPCLVLETALVRGTRYITLTYGTSVPGKAVRGYTIRVSDPTVAALAGLRRPTCFLANRRVTVTADNPGFAVSRTRGTAVIGRLSGDELARMHAVRARLHAEADMAADRRAERRRERAEEHRAAQQRPAQPAPSARAH